MANCVKGLAEVERVDGDVGVGVEEGRDFLQQCYQGAGCRARWSEGKLVAEQQGWRSCAYRWIDELPNDETLQDSSEHGCDGDWPDVCRLTWLRNLWNGQYGGFFPLDGDGRGDNGLVEERS